VRHAAFVRDRVIEAHHFFAGVAELDGVLDLLLINDFTHDVESDGMVLELNPFGSVNLTARQHEGGECGDGQ
jgi:hypothetical protein